MLKEFVRTDDGLDAEVRKTETKRLQAELVSLLQPLKEAKIPVIVLVEGWASAGKGSLLRSLISEIDPRSCDLFSLDNVHVSLDQFHFLYPYVCAMPENGKVLFMDGGWLQKAVDDDIRGLTDKSSHQHRIDSINHFERQLKNNGYLVIKFFVDISKREQSKRQKKLLDNPDTAWRVSDADRWQNKHYDEYRTEYLEWMNVLSVTPWHLLDGTDKRSMHYDTLRILCETLREAIRVGKYDGAPYEEIFPMSDPLPRLEDADLTAKLDEETYKKELKILQRRIGNLQNQLYREQIPVIICYEGWDAAGKGGNIRRLAQALDPRGYTTFPIASPEPREKSRHHLWRFWVRLPERGRIAIFDRTWYGRVMVERLEGFCSENDWKRAYNEINEFEKELSDDGNVIVKFWIHIDPDTQLARFNERQNTPEKRWKITDEDWRNREKWPQYEEAVKEMLAKTSTKYAPWHIVESTDKLYARIKALQIVADSMQAALDKAHGKT